MKLDNVRLLVTNFDDCLHFYQEILGFNLTWGEVGGNYASFDVGDGKVLALFRKNLMAEAVGTVDLPVQSVAQDRFACVFKVTNLEQTVRDIEERGGRFISSIQKKPLWGIQAVHLRDPEGNLIEIITGLPEEEWDESLLEKDRKYES
ncbi:VOC family protein [Ornithinibacillus salinisoli]|uniref:VOC family protein n=1 Tax=Ornithinibacillus salinisoli TaxID=1848459 RepID=A0ABW4W144_9BACI